MTIKRVFIAVDIPEFVRKEIKEVQQKLKKEDVFRGRYVEPHNMHITLKFLGDVDESLLPTLQTRLKTVKYRLLHAHLGKLDLFKSLGSNAVRVIFLSIDCPGLADLVAQIDERLADLFTSEKRSFVSHLTIARVKEIADYDILADIIQQLHVEPVAFDIGSFVLKQSVLSAEGPIYTEIERYIFSK